MLTAMEDTFKYPLSLSCVVFISYIDGGHTPHNLLILTESYTVQLGCMQCSQATDMLLSKALEQANCKRLHLATTQKIKHRTDNDK